MAKYTIELRNVCQLYGGREAVEEWFKDYELSDYLSQEEIQKIAERGTWNKDRLAEEIVDHFWMREIGLETPALFKHKAKVKMRELMEEMLPVIYSASWKYDPLVNLDFKETFAQTSTQEDHNTGSSQSSSSGLSVASDVPQGQISKSEILAGKYASSTGADSTEDQSSTQADGSQNATQNYERHTVGNSGVSFTPMSATEDYRKIIRAVNRDIITELETLFMGIY